MKEAQEIIKKELEEVLKTKDIYLNDMDLRGENEYNTSRLNELFKIEMTLKRIINELELKMKEGE